MQDARETLIAWLRDAHAMERATMDNIERLLDRMERYPDFRARYDLHLRDSAAQLGRIERCLDTLDADRSLVKDTMMRVTGFAEAFATSIAPDAAVKHCLAAYSYENFEAASYVSLIAAAEALGFSQIAELCGHSLAEERAMALWLENYIPEITQAYLNDANASRSARETARASAQRD
jgi:ferritin-like metal-binding protein YciE